MKIKKILWIIIPAVFLGSCASGTKIVDQSNSLPQEQIDQKAYDFYMEGALYDFQDQYEKALLQYYQALLYDSTSAQIMKAIARDLMRLQQYESAVQYLKKSHRYNPDDRETINYLGEAYFNLKDYQNALTYYELLFKMDPYNTTAENNLLYLYSNLKMEKKQLELYRQLMNYYPGDTQRAIQYAMALLREKKVEEAQQVLRGVVKEDSTQLNALFVLGNLHEINRDTTTAVQIYHKILKSDPLNEDALTHLYRIYRSRQNWNGIEQTYNSVVAADSSNSQARLVLAEAYYYDEKGDSAAQLLQPVLDDSNYRSGALELLGRIAFDNKNYAEAENYFKALTGENPQNRFGWLFLSLLYNQQKQYQNSVDILKQAFIIHKDDPVLLGMYGTTLDQMGKGEEALEPLEKAHRLDPNDVNTIASLAALYDKLKMWDKSDSLYEAVLQKLPNNALLLNNYSYSLVERNAQMNKALNLVDRALKIEPENGAYLDTKGWIYYKMGKYQKALEYIKKALNGREESAEVLEHMGDVYLKLGQPEEASRYWKNALEKDPSNEELKEKINSL